MADQNFKSENLSEFLRKILIPTNEISGGKLTPTPSELKTTLKSKQKKQLIEKYFL